MKSWGIVLGGLVVWAAHFFALYIVASLFPGEDTARWLTIAATLPALAADAYILLRLRNGSREGLDRWAAQLGAVAAALSLLAVIWQALPAVLV